MHEITTIQQLKNVPQRQIIQRLDDFAKAHSVQLFLVGGCVRDLLLNRRTSDLDLALKSKTLEFAGRFAAALGETFVILEERPATARVIIRETGFTLDFVQFRGETVEDDLRLRDLTINAMALELCSFVAGSAMRPIDPCNGLQDLKSRRLRFPSEFVILADPLRLLRAYRFAALLNFEISEEAIHLIRQHKALLRQSDIDNLPSNSVAAERIRDELIKILSASNAVRYLREMDDSGLLHEILPEICSMRNFRPDNHPHLNMWEHSLRALELFENQSVPETLRPYQMEIEQYLQSDLTTGTRRIIIVKLSLLLYNLAKPMKKKVNPLGELEFAGHENVGAEMVVLIAKRLRLGEKSVSLMRSLVQNHPRITQLLETGETRQSIGRFLNATADDWLGVMILSYADLRVSQGELRSPNEKSKAPALMKRIADSYYLEIVPIKMQGPLLSGDTIMQTLDLQPSVMVGKILTHIAELRFDGKIHTPEEALVAARRFLEKCK